MELSASYSYRPSHQASRFFYGGLPDSMHITEGVLTGGAVYGAFKLEASGFKCGAPEYRRTVYGRAETVKNDELLDTGVAGAGQHGDHAA